MFRIEKVSHTAVVVVSVAAVALIVEQRHSASVQSRVSRAMHLDLAGNGVEARELWQQEIETAGSIPEKVRAMRAMAISWAFDRNCAKVSDCEQAAIGLLATKKRESPFAEAGVANEAGHLCLDAGSIDAASRWYAQGHALALRDPGLTADGEALCAFRLAHAEARIGARRGDGSLAKTKFAVAKTALDQMTPGLRMSQAPYLGALAGYVAFYLNDYNGAISEFKRVGPGDPFVACMLAQAYERVGDTGTAAVWYRDAARADGHDVSTAYARPLARKKLGLQGGGVSFWNSVGLVFRRIEGRQRR
jgi:hypothetical protein